ncbi:MAG: glycosyltransferase [Guyparkeria sp.]
MRAGVPIRLAAKLDVVDKDYFDNHVRPLRQHPLVEFIGEIGDDEKGEFLGNAMALLLPIDWAEPFGMVMIEAMACGTPVVAWRRGAVPEVLDEAVTGFVVETLDDAVTAVGRCPDLDRARVRQRFEARFSAARMADQYLRVYRNLTDRSAAL